MERFYSYKTKDAKGNDFDFGQLRGRVALVVNVASHCGYTSQYAGLEELHREFEPHGLSVVGFPCNQFGSQEPGSNDEIIEFCKLTYDVSFPIMSKTDVNGPKSPELFDYLKSSAPGILGTEAIKWNFTKFLVGRDGKVLGRFAPTTEPMDLVVHIQVALGVQSELAPL